MDVDEDRGHHATREKGKNQQRQGKSLVSTNNKEQELVVYCYICAKAGHIVRNCYYKKGPPLEI